MKSIINRAMQTKVSEIVIKKDCVTFARIPISVIIFLINIDELFFKKKYPLEVNIQIFVYSIQ